MLSRRRALAVMGAAIGGATASPADDRAHLGSRVYSEEGIAMFAACENLEAAGTAPKQAAATSPLNQKAASAFQRYAQEWQHAHPTHPPAMWPQSSNS